MAFCRHSSGLDVDERPFLALAIKVPEAQKSLFRVNSIALKRRLKGRAEKEEKEIKENLINLSLFNVIWLRVKNSKKGNLVATKMGTGKTKNNSNLEKRN